MIRQDYLMAVIEQFFQAIARMLKIRQEEPDKLEPLLAKLYSDYLGLDREFFLTSDMSDIYRVFGDSENTLARTEMLAELFYRELQLFGAGPGRKELAENLLGLYDYIDRESREFSFERVERRAEVRKWLDSAE